MRISIQACIESEGSSSPKVITIGCIERDAGVDRASGVGLFVREAHATPPAARAERFAYSLLRARPDVAVIGESGPLPLLPDPEPSLKLVKIGR